MCRALLLLLLMCSDILALKYTKYTHILSLTHTHTQSAFIVHQEWTLCLAWCSVMA